MRPFKGVLFAAMGLFAAHVIVAAASLKTGPLPLLSHLIQLGFGVFTLIVSLQAARRSSGLARDFWWFASAGFSLWCIGQFLDTLLGVVLNVPFETRWEIDVFYYAWPASLLICLSLAPANKEKEHGWIWERVLDLVQAGIVFVMLYTYFSGAPMHARGPGVWRLSLATDGLIAGGFFARAFLSPADPTSVLFRRFGYFRLTTFLTDLYFVLGFQDSIRHNWFDLIWSAQWLFPLLTAAAWQDPGVQRDRSERSSSVTAHRSSIAAQIVPLAFPFFVVLLAVEVAKGRLAVAAIAVVFSLSVSYGRLMISRRQEQASTLDRNRAVEALTESESRFRSLFEGSPIAISILDLKGRSIASNDAYHELVGVGPGEPLDIDTLMSLTDPASREADRRLFQQLASGEYSQVRREKQYVRRDGKVVWVDLSHFLQRKSSGEPQFVIAMAVDITERKQLEEQLRQSQRMETIGRLAGGVAHDFNNLLTVIKGYCDLVIETHASDSALRARVEHINRAAGKAASLTHQLLAFSRQQVLQPKVFNLNTLVSETSKMLSRLIGENIQMNVTTSPDLGCVSADPGQIEQVILNLVVNARDAMLNGGKLTISTSNACIDEQFARVHVGAEPGRYVQLSVSDTGVGMDPETLSHIFEPFYTTKALGKGTGLGLSMVYGIVKQSKGSIWVTSEPSKGSTFSIYLPRVDSQEEKAEAEAAPLSAISGVETMLVVEDDPQVRELAREVLSSRGYLVLVASCPEEALHLSGRHDGPIHLLVTDLVMPGMSGLELASELRKIRPKVRALFMSGYTDPQLAEACALDTTAPFLQKPFTPATLTHTIRQILDQVPS